MATLTHRVNNTPVVRQLNAAGSAYLGIKLNASNNWVLDTNLDVGGYLGRFGNNGDENALLRTILRVGHDFTSTGATDYLYGVHLGITGKDVTNVNHTGHLYALPITFGPASTNTANWTGGASAPIAGLFLEASLPGTNTYTVTRMEYISLGSISMGANVTITDFVGIRIGALTGAGTITSAWGILFTGEPSKGSIATDTNINLKINVQGTGSFDIYDDNVKTLDFASGAFAFQQATSLSTASGGLTLQSAANNIALLKQLVAAGGGVYKTIKLNASNEWDTDAHIVPATAAGAQLGTATLYWDYLWTDRIRGAVSGSNLAALNADAATFDFYARDSGSALAIVAKLVGAADPYFEATLPMRLLPVATASLPGTPVEGMIAYDDTANKLKVYTGAAWETVTSA